MRKRSGGRERAGTSAAEERVGVGGDERGGRGERWVASTDRYPGLGLEAKAWALLLQDTFLQTALSSWPLERGWQVTYQDG